MKRAHVDARLLVAPPRIVPQLVKDVVELGVGDIVARPLLCAVSVLEPLLAAPELVHHRAVLVHNLLPPLGDDSCVVHLLPPPRLLADIARELIHPQLDERDGVTRPEDKGGRKVERRGWYGHGESYCVDLVNQLLSCRSCPSQGSSYVVSLLSVSFGQPVHFTAP